MGAVGQPVPFWTAGFTVMIERKIIGRLQGEDALQFHAANGWASMQEAVAKIGKVGSSQG